MRAVLAGVLLPPVGLERDRLRRPGLPARIHAPGRPGASAAAVLEPFERPGAYAADPVREDGRQGWSRWVTSCAGCSRARVGPRDNDSRYLLDVHRRDLPGEATMRRFADDDEVDLVIVGAGAGGSVLAQRLARHGWRIVILEAGPFWHPDEDWVSDEAGSHHLYWTQKRIIGGADPIELGKNNSGRGVGGSMVHYAGYTPRFHPSDFATRSRDGVGADWPIAYEDLRPHYERVERRAAGGRAGLAVGPPAPLPALAAPGLRRRRRAARGRPALRDRDAGRPGRHRQRDVRQPPALHLPRLLPAGLQGQRQGQPVRHAPARRARARRRGPR